MRKSLITIASIGFLGSMGVVQAADCGESPQDTPTIPNGETATAETIRAARESVISFSDKVDAYLACMDNRAPTILPYLSKEQKNRWDEDLANLHDKRRDLQTQMNQAIRAYRRVSPS